MGLFPQSFVDDVRVQSDIVQVIQAHVPLRRAGASYKGLCPFHTEKTPSFHVNRDKGMFYCFGCGSGGDVFKFVELHERVGFQDAVRLLAERLGIPVPATADGRRDPAAERERERLLEIHEMAAAWFRDQLGGPGGARAREQLRSRELSADTIEMLGIGFAPPHGSGLIQWLRKNGVELSAIVRAGLAVQRENGQAVDRFRGRLMIPICRDSGTIVAFGGRAMTAEQQPKYLNSPETPIYTKGRTVYGLHLTKDAVRRVGYAVLVEGYFDFAQARQAGIAPVVASCGTALTAAQAQLLRRYASRIVLSYDPDAAGEGAAVRSCDLLVSEGFQVNVAVLPGGEDPDTFIRNRGGAAYMKCLRLSRPYLEYLLDRTASRYDLSRDESRLEFLSAMLPIAGRIPEAAARDQFGDRLAHKAGITEEVVRAEIRKAAVSKRTTVQLEALPAAGQVRPAEQGLIWALVNDVLAAQDAFRLLEAEDLEGLATGPVLALARSLEGWPIADVPTALFERLNPEEAEIVRRIAAAPVPPAPPDACVESLKRLRFERERAALQSEIRRLQEIGGAGAEERIAHLWERKKDLLHRLDAR
jgi:DNA primase